MAAPKVKETTIQSMILTYLKTRRILHNRINNGQFFIKETGKDKYGRTRNKSRAVRCNTLNGIPDIEVFVFAEKGKTPLFQFTVYLEVKTKTGKQSNHQKLFQKRIQESGGYYFVVRSIDDVVKAFNDVEESLHSKFGNDVNLKYIKAFSLAETAPKK